MNNQHPAPLPAQRSMKKNNLILLLVALGIGAVLVLTGIGKYNGMVNLDADVQNSWSKVQTAYQRRADLIPNLVSTVKGYADFEQQTLTQVIEARQQVTNLNIDPNNLTPEAFGQFQQAQGQLSGALQRLLVTVERYPELKADARFADLQHELASTENQIKFERDAFNNTATGYNKYIRQFPNNLFAGVFNFDQRALFEAEAGSQNAPKVSFD
jgi:LemA protein